MSECLSKGCRNLETRCKDCGRLVCGGLNFNPHPNDWIDIDYPPEEGKKVLMTYNNLVLIGVYKNKKFYDDTLCAHTPGYCRCEEQEGITHWMPLPKGVL